VKHTIRAVHFPYRKEPAPATLDCECGVHMEATANEALPDIWEPLTDLWLAHRRSVGAGPAAHVGTDHGETGYQFGRQAVSRRVA